MTLAVSFTTAAEADLAKAVLWYEEQREGLSHEFEDELSRTLRRLSQGPHQFPTVEADLRRAALRRFPYVVFFRADGKGVLIVAVFHTRQDQEVWRARI